MHQKDDALFSHAATILLVSNIETSLAFYKNTLGFSCTFAWKNPIEYAVLKKGAISIHLSQTTKAQNPIKGRPALSIFVHNIDTVYRTLVQNNVAIHTAIGNRDYGMRDFDILDPDGYMITFGEEI